MTFAARPNKYHGLFDSNIAAKIRKPSRRTNLLFVDTLLSRRRGLTANATGAAAILRKISAGAAKRVADGGLAISIRHQGFPSGPSVLQPPADVRAHATGTTLS